MPSCGCGAVELLETPAEVELAAGRWLAASR